MNERQKQNSLNIRKATLDDANAIRNILNYYIEKTVIAHETELVSEIDSKQRISDIIDSGYLFFIGEIDGKVIGFCCTQPWNKGVVYETTAEESIFLDKDETGKGYGTKLLEHLLNQVDKTKIHILNATISLPNESSVRLHEKLGFKQVSQMKEIGRKFDQWLDIGCWQLILA